jgi:hypothetical protein
MKKVMMNQVTGRETTDIAWEGLYRVGGLAALMVGVLFLAALVDLVLSALVSGAAITGLSLLENNWLVVLFKLNAGFNGATYDQLHELNPLDITILALVAAMYLGLYAALWRTSKIGSIIAALQPFLGIVLLIATKTAGRSGVMGAALVISLVMLRSNIFSRLAACLGILASVLLLVGDLSTTPGSPSNFLAILIGIGYVLLTAWFFLIGRRLLQLGQPFTPGR